jgi:hypothetical protein
MLDDMHLRVLLNATHLSVWLMQWNCVIMLDDMHLRVLLDATHLSVWLMQYNCV